MGYMGTFYVEVQANQISTFSVDIPSGVDTTSGYYISYNVALENAGGGFTGTGWYLDELGNPFTGTELSTEQAIIDHYNGNQGNLNDIFGGWIGNAGEVAVSNFCNMLMNGEAYSSGCISMV